MRMAILLALLAAGCLPTPEYACTTDAQCSGGTCQLTVGFCSFADTLCASGQRFGESAGTQANQCVGGVPNDGGMEAMDTGLGCSAMYMTITGGQGNHMYRLISSSDAWNDQRDACAADGANVYMAIPDDATELTAITALTNDARMWVGITDSVTENTFLTTKGTPATFLPWDANQPNNINNSDCVAVVAASQLFDDERCNTFTVQREAVCECEP